jgi:NitT/TauT family transport system ATP-binding protein
MGDGAAVRVEPVTGTGSIVRLDAVSVDYVSPSGETLRALEEVSMEIARERVTVLVGPSGCGKTTVLNLIAGFVRPTKGRLVWEGQQGGMDAGRNRKPRIGYIFQENSVFPWLTVRGNLEFGLRSFGFPKSLMDVRIREWLMATGLEGFGHFYPHQLSGGMRQRVAVARALIYDPDVVLADEPFAALDEFTKERLILFLGKLLMERPFTVVYVTHSLLEAALLGDVIFAMSARPGRVIGRFSVGLPRPRDPESVGVWEVVKGVREVLAEGI